MATDVEESDNDENEKPVPAKRQKTLSVNSVDNQQENVSFNVYFLF